VRRLFPISPGPIILGVIAGQFLLEPADGLPKAAAKTGEAPGSEEQHDNYEDDEKLGNPKAHDKGPPPRRILSRPAAPSG
jgi:hypothetical protein